MAPTKRLSDIKLYQGILQQNEDRLSSSYFYITHILSPTVIEHKEQREKNHTVIPVVYAVQDKASKKIAFESIYQSWRMITYVKTGYLLRTNGSVIPLESQLTGLNIEGGTDASTKLHIGMKAFEIPEKSQTRIVTPSNDPILQDMYFNLAKTDFQEFMDEEFLRFDDHGKPVYIPAAEIINALILQRKDTVTKFALRPNASSHLYTKLEQKDDDSYHIDLSANVKSSELKTIFFLLKNVYTTTIFNNIYNHWCQQHPSRRKNRYADQHHDQRRYVLLSSQPPGFHRRLNESKW